MLRTFAVATFVLTLSACGSHHSHHVTERPGLGTAWGETRESAARSVSFEREDPAEPAAVALLHYDDRGGLRAAAQGRDFAEEPGDGADGAFRVRLLDGGGEPLPSSGRGSRRYVEGREGERYAIDIENRTAVRVEAVATVDGLDVIDGGPGSFDKRGYVIGPWGSLRIDGFRRSVDEVAAFRFGTVADSYAAQKGDDANVGMIGVAFFVERGSPSRWRAREAERRRHADPFPGRFAEPPRRPW